ncbi:MAG: hypothetical protein ABIP48_29550 [Planctomycetota bacterium]
MKLEVSGVFLIAVLALSPPTGRAEEASTTSNKKGVYYFQQKRN